MSQLRIEQYEMPGAPVGPENPLPALRRPAEWAGAPEPGEGVSEEEARYIGWGRDNLILPHRLQDGYGRVKRPMSFRAAVLENETLRATFLLDLGGRLWSLYHKPAQRELLETNPAFQPANLAVRNAWFSGGVEWNVGIGGHTPYTCSPLFAARVDDGGTPVLRLYEWDRVRRVFYQLDAYLPDGSPVLFVRPRILNPRDEEIPIYWWSNIAVPEKGARVITPSESAYKMSYDGKFGVVPIPVWEGVDVTYPENHRSSCDFFYRLFPGRRPWETAVYEDGKGLIQTSTARLRGRKLFVWGMDAGGRRWQEFLSEPGRAYIEIQAGLARTQYECVPMPGRADWSWLEAYGLMEADPDVVRGDDWAAAREEVSRRLDDLIPGERMEFELLRTEPMANRPPEEILQRGSGWGALEQVRRPSFVPTGVVFDEASLGPDQAPWMELLGRDEMPEAPPDRDPGAFMVQDEWRELLETAVAIGKGSHWLAWLHLGVMRYHAGNHDGAREAWERSLSLAPSAWALRNLAVLEKDEGRLGEAADLLVKACRMLPSQTRLVIETCESLIAAERADEMGALLDEVPEEVRSHGRIKMLEVRAALDCGDLDRAEKALFGKFDMGDIREGEVSLTDLWFTLHEKRLAAQLGVPVDDALRERVRREFPPPAEMDFRMRIPAT
jgi:hypothetical protein